jgi:hypothetical protein
VGQFMALVDGTGWELASVRPGTGGRACDACIHYCPKPNVSFEFSDFDLYSFHGLSPTSCWCNVYFP